ncbi:MAG TPA: hypothetical protein VKV06_16895 [Acidimicrobiales bacterium]|nr:hypothetical protein [Acidimicrobiales bacterium]
MRRRVAAIVVAVATVGAAALLPLVDAAASVAPAGCPKAPPRPATSTEYRTDGYRWNPSETIYYRVDTARLRSSQIKARVADAKRAMRASSTYSGLAVRYLGTESKLKSPSTHDRLVQFEYAELPKVKGVREGVSVNLFFYHGTKQMYSATIDTQITTATGYGPFDPGHPTRSAEGHLLLFGVGLTMGLAEGSIKWPVVMNPTTSTHSYYTRYQAGDRFGLWKVGASAGCGGFKY